jgi:probable rRNA maturation factor
MRNDLAHKITFSKTPLRLLTDPKSRQALSWDRRDMTRRMLFVLGLICERPASVHVEFVDELQMGALNWQFRGKDKPTDVLSFPPHHVLEPEQPGVTRGAKTLSNLGELAICVEVCSLQSKRHRCTLAHEVERMMIHGLLHLKGFDHERSQAAHAVMTSLEKGIRSQLLKQFGEPDFCREVSRKKTAPKPGGRR